MLVTSLFPPFLPSYFITYIAIDPIKVFLLKILSEAFGFWIRHSPIVVISTTMISEALGKNKINNYAIQRK